MKSSNTHKFPLAPQHIQGNGTSLWGESKGKFIVDSVSVDYINWVSYPKDKSRIHASVTLAGPDTDGNVYTDKGVENAVNKNRAILTAVRKLVMGRLKHAGIKKRLPAFYLNWSEYGMQGEKYWNFDLCPLTKTKK